VVTVNSKEENSQDFRPNYVLEFGLRTVYCIGVQQYLFRRTIKPMTHDPEIVLLEKRDWSCVLKRGGGKFP
jgi:hypothetical protein